jgi:hypothetical protein
MIDKGQTRERPCRGGEHRGRAFLQDRLSARRSQTVLARACQNLRTGLHAGGALHTNDGGHMLIMRILRVALSATVTCSGFACGPLDDDEDPPLGESSGGTPINSIFRPPSPDDPEGPVVDESNVPLPSEFDSLIPRAPDAIWGSKNQGCPAVVGFPMYDVWIRYTNPQAAGIVGYAIFAPSRDGGLYHSVMGLTPVFATGVTEAMHLNTTSVATDIIDGTYGVELVDVNGDRHLVTDTLKRGVFRNDALFTVLDATSEPGLGVRVRLRTHFAGRVSHTFSYAMPSECAIRIDGFGMLFTFDVDEEIEIPIQGVAGRSGETVLVALTGESGRPTDWGDPDATFVREQQAYGTFTFVVP